MSGIHCFYCRAPSHGRCDHVVPLAYTSINSRRLERKRSRRSVNRDLQVPACEDCNRLLGNRVFSTVETRLRFLLDQLLAKQAEPERIRFLRRVIELSELIE